MNQLYSVFAQKHFHKLMNMSKALPSLLQAACNLSELANYHQEWCYTNKIAVTFDLKAMHVGQYPIPSVR